MKHLFCFEVGINVLVVLNRVNCIYEPSSQYAYPNVVIGLTRVPVVVVMVMVVMFVVMVACMYLDKTIDR
jgi:hypothetical protein